MASIFTFLKQDTLFSKGLISLALLLLTFGVSRLAPVIEGLFIRVFIGKTKTDLDDKIFHLFVNSIRKLIWLVGFFFILKTMSSVLPESILIYGKGLLYVIAVLVIAHLICQVLLLLLEWSSKRLKDRVKIREEFTPLIKKVIYIIVYVIAIVTILQHFKQNVSSLIVSLGVGSLAVALAAKDTLANMISGFMIMTDRPFRIGDRIMLESGEKGDVYDIGLRTTKILTFDNTLIVVPNKQIIDEKLTNLSYPDPQIRVKVNVGVAYGSDLDHVKSLLIGICNDHPDVLQDPPPTAYFLNFGDSALDIQVVCRVATWGQQWRVAEEIRMEIYQIFNKEGIEIPFPQRVVTINKKNEDEG